MSYLNSYKGARSRKMGLAFENLITASCDYYRSIKMADIEKTPEPMRPVSGGDKGGRFIAVYTEQAQPDFKGTLKGGRSVNFEAKYTDTDKMSQYRVSPTQAVRLGRMSDMGGVAFVLCSFGARDFFRVPWAVWNNMKETFGRKYVTAKDLEPFRVKVGKTGVLLFLEGLN